MILNKLLYNWIKKDIPNIEILDITLNSKLVKKGSLFFAIKGYNLDGRNFIQESIKLGSSAILVETELITEHAKIIFYDKVIIIFFYKLKLFISEISGNYYYNPSKYMNLIGITGTNGKTTISYILSKWINLIGEKSALIGTLGNGQINYLKKTENTTDSPIDIQRNLYEFNKSNINFVTLEVSSHSIVQHRVKNLEFKSAIYTNISHEHLDFHKNMFNYKLSKYMLFSKHKIQNSIINIDDKFGNIISRNIKNSINVSLYKEIIIKKQNIYIRINNISFHGKITLISLKSNLGVFNIKLNFIGYFNINNFLLSLVTLLNLNYPLKDLIKLSSYIYLPEGRMEIIEYDKSPLIIIDFAHTPDAMKKLFITIRNNYNNRKIWCIFGCGGNKDKYKRSIMGEIAYKYSNYIILTNDNPRYEDQIKIIKDIIIGIKNNINLNVILDREKAIKYAILNSNLNDIILILGKGSEEYQIFKNRKFFFSDKKTVIKLLNNDLKNFK